MTTAYTNTPVSNANDAGFRAWTKEIHDALIAVGCLQTADTGQINFATVLKPTASSTVGGYALYDINDSLSGSAPISVKVEYGTGGSQFMLGLWVTIGTGSDGSGNLTGSVSSRMALLSTNSITSTTTNRESYTCKVDGFLGCQPKIGSTTSASGTCMGFFVCRPVNLDGTIRSDGAALYVTVAGYPRCQAVEFATGNTYGSSTNKNYCLLPQDITSTSVGTNNQALRHMIAYPEIHSVNGVCSALCSELGLGSTMSCALNGATSHTYVMLGSASSPYGVTGASANAAATDSKVGLCMLWE